MLAPSAITFAVGLVAMRRGRLQQEDERSAQETVKVVQPAREPAAERALALGLREAA